MTHTTLAAALIAGVPRYRLNGYDAATEPAKKGGIVFLSDVLAALSTALDGVEERAGEVLEGVMPYDGDPCGCAYCADNPATLYRNGEALCGECQDRQEAALVPALLAQNAALRAERDALDRQLSNVSFDAECEAEDKRDAAYGAAEWQRRAEAAEAQIAALTARVEGLTGALEYSRKVHCAIADHCLENKPRVNSAPIFADSQRARLAIDAALSATTEEGK